MAGSNQKQTDPKPETGRKAILQALRQPPSGGHYVWDGQNEDDKPLTTEELATAKRGPGRPRLNVARPMVSMRIDPDVVERLRASGKGWQTRVNALLREAVESGRL